MKNNISFIGGGNMAYAIAKGIVDANLINNDNIIISDVSTERLDYIKNNLEVKVTNDNIEAIKNSEIIIMAVKPQIFKVVASNFASALENKCVISIMAGVSADYMKSVFPKSTRVLRVMPNMPALVGEGMTALCVDNDLKDDEYSLAKEIFDAVGEICEIKEQHIEAVTGISGSGPAYVFMFIEALADAGVLHGLPRDISYKLAAQTLKGSAVTVAESGIHPGELKDRVSSPAGTTIEAVKSLENDGFRSAVINAVDVCIKKAKRM